MNIPLWMLWFAVPIDALVLWLVYRAGVRRGRELNDERVAALERRVDELQARAQDWIA